MPAIETEPFDGQHNPASVTLASLASGGGVS